MGQEPIVRSTLWAIWLLVPGSLFRIKISFGLRATVEVGLISVCSRNQAESGGRTDRFFRWCFGTSGQRDRMAIVF